MGECDYVLISLVRVPKVWDESEDFGRDSVYWRDNVSPGPNQMENLENVLLKNIELKHDMYQLQSTRSFRLLV